MALSSARKRSGAIADINVTPLADVMIVLLIIFMVATPVITGAPVTLPPAAHASEGPQTLKIVVSAEGAVVVDGSPLDDGGLRSLVRERLVSAPALPVLVQADEAAPYAQVARVLDACRGAGVEEIRLATQAKIGR